MELGMLRQSWFIARKDVWHMLRGRETLLWLFVMPVVFIYFIGTVTGGMGGGTGAEKDVLALRAPDSAGYLVDRLVKHLQGNDYAIVRPDTQQDFAARSRRLTIPEGFTESVLGGKKTVLQFAASETGLGQDLDKIRVSRSIYTVLADVVAVTESGEVPGPEAFARLDSMPRTLAVDVQSAGKRPRVPSGFEQAVSGIMVMFTLIVLLTSGAVMLVIERRQGLLRRLSSTPLSRGAIVLGKWGARLALGLVQIAFAMTAGTVLFEMSWGPDLPMVILALVGWGALCASVGLLLGNLARTEGQAIAIGVLAGNLLAAFGGCWWPIEITPRWMQAFARSLPTGWAMDALHRLISYQAGASSALIHVLLMFAASIAVARFTARRFRFQ
jgi:ABC-type Na+ efflux pump permease subunit